MTAEEKSGSKPSVRKRADEIRPFRCKNLIAVLENPTDVKNIGTVIRNVNALGVEKVYVVDPRHALPDDWQELREAMGISDRAVERSDMCVSIPMFGMIESLNLRTSSGIVLYEVAKQRREYQSKYRLRKRRGARAIPLPTVIPPKT